MTTVRLTQLDGKLPNLALAKIARYWSERGADVRLFRSYHRDIEDLPHYDHVYGSAIFAFSADHAAAFRQQWPGAVLGGTWDTSDATTVEDVLGSVDGYDLTPWHNWGFDASIGFTQRGCRLKCGFCVVPKKEGANRTVATIAEIWRGPGNGRFRTRTGNKVWEWQERAYPKHLHLLDNDFFGQPEAEWRARAREIIDGGFKVCLNQGINVRLLDDRAAEALAAMDYRDDSFTAKRIYTAWDSIGDEKRFFTGMDRLVRYGIPPGHVMAFMLIGYDKRETWERLMYRYERMRDYGIRPYPMLFDPTRKRGLPAGGAGHEVLVRRGMTLQQFQRWVNGRYAAVTPFAEFEPHDKALTTKAGKQHAEQQMVLL